MSGGPTKLGLTLTRRCTAGCIMCSRRRQRGWGARTDETPTERVIELLQRYKDMLSSVELGAFGEPLMHTDFNGVLAACCDAGISTNLSTNGALLHRHLGILDLPGLLSISLDGAEAKTFESIRPGLKYVEVIANMQLAARYSRHTSRHIGISMVIMQRNKRLVYDTARLAHDMGYNYFCPIRMYDFGLPHLLAEQLPVGHPLVVEQLARVRADFPLLVIADYFNDRYGLVQRPHVPTCPHPNSSLDFTPTGRAFTCCWTTGLDLGHWDDVDVWNNARRLRLQDQLEARQLDAQEFPDCAVCPLRWPDV